MRKPGISKVGFHALCERAHCGGVIFESLPRSGNQSKSIGVLQKKSIHAGRFGNFCKSLFGVTRTAGACVIVGDGNMPTDILNKRGAAFEVPGQSLVSCEGASHAPGF